MTYTKKAIELAIEGGFKEPDYGNAPIFLARYNHRDTVAEMYHSWIFQNPIFWKSLCKALGLENKHYAKSYLGNPEMPKKFRHHVCIQKCTRWKYEMHHFIDHIIEGKDPESFFQELLKGK